MIINVLNSYAYDCLDRSSGSPCKGSSCMAWRWVDTRRVYGFCGRAGEPMSKMIEPPRQD